MSKLQSFCTGRVCQVAPPSAERSRRSGECGRQVAPAPRAWKAVPVVPRQVGGCCWSGWRAATSLRRSERAMRVAERARVRRRGACCPLPAARAVCRGPYHFWRPVICCVPAVPPALLLAFTARIPSWFLAFSSGCLVFCFSLSNFLGPFPSLLDCCKRK